MNRIYLYMYVYIYNIVSLNEYAYRMNWIWEIMIFQKISNMPCSHMI